MQQLQYCVEWKHQWTIVLYFGSDGKVGSCKYHCNIALNVPNQRCLDIHTMAGVCAACCRPNLSLALDRALHSHWPVAFPCFSIALRSQLVFRIALVNQTVDVRQKVVPGCTGSRTAYRNIAWGEKKLRANYWLEGCDIQSHGFCMCCIIFWSLYCAGCRQCSTVLHTHATLHIYHMFIFYLHMLFAYSICCLGS